EPLVLVPVLPAAVLPLVDVDPVLLEPVRDVGRDPHPAAVAVGRLRRGGVGLVARPVLLGTTARGGGERQGGDQPGGGEDGTTASPPARSGRTCTAHGEMTPVAMNECRAAHASSAR